MSARLTATTALLAGALMVLAIACDSAPASIAPTPGRPDGDSCRSGPSGPDGDCCCSASSRPDGDRS